MRRPKNSDEWLFLIFALIVTTIAGCVLVGSFALVALSVYIATTVNDIAPKVLFLIIAYVLFLVISKELRNLVSFWRS